jgi:hypothetical protein
LRYMAAGFIEQKIEEESDTAPMGTVGGGALG